jgi:NADH-quinone oxidoreductase subunit J/NAD(P)H-quinone oxidoreductase subunit 6
MAEAILFYSLAALAVISAGLVVTVRNIFHAALYLALALFAVAALYVTLGAYFLAAIQVLVYIGAVVVLAIFVISLTRTVTGAPVTLTRRWVLPAALVSALTACLIAVALLKSAAGGAAPPAPGGDGAALLGMQLLGGWVLPFELVSVLLLSALIAAIAVVGKDREDET